MLQGYQIRMLEEYKQLNDRVEKLGKFINESPVFSKMEVHKQILQRWQLSAMKSYRDALKKMSGRRIFSVDWGWSGINVNSINFLLKTS